MQLPLECVQGCPRAPFGVRPLFWFALQATLSIGRQVPAATVELRR